VRSAFPPPTGQRLGELQAEADHDAAEKTRPKKRAMPACLPRTWAVQVGGRPARHFCRLGLHGMTVTTPRSMGIEASSLTPGSYPASKWNTCDRRANSDRAHTSSGRAKGVSWREAVWRAGGVAAGPCGDRAACATESQTATDREDGRVWQIAASGSVRHQARTAARSMMTSRPRVSPSTSRTVSAARRATRWAGLPRRSPGPAGSCGGDCCWVTCTAMQHTSKRRNRVTSVDTSRCSAVAHRSALGRREAGVGQRTPPVPQYAPWTPEQAALRGIAVHFTQWGNAVKDTQEYKRVSCLRRAP